MKHRNLYHSFRDAWRGILHVFRSERNMRIHLIAGLVVLLFAGISGVPRLEFLILILTIGMMFVAEIINTAFEEVVNLITKEYHPLAGLVKNIAAGAVLVAALTSLWVGYIVLKDKLLP
ncbi:MAG: diacylglycerol kinase family protein [Firmicutes bacterium]|nr:diacylglycerol kinase family protein [Bacillota bacterium]